MQETVQTLRAISIQQPWLDFILEAGKDVENRDRDPHYTGPLLLHQSSTLADFEPVMRRLLERNLVTDRVVHILQRWYCAYGKPESAIVGIANLAEVTANSESPWADEDEYQFVLQHSTRLAEPVPYLGRPYFFKVMGRVVWPEDEGLCPRLEVAPCDPR